MMSPKPTAFVAYPSRPESLAETIEEAIKTIADTCEVDIKGWKSVSTSGHLIITAICDSIRESDLFIADITALNHNVLFELGYAIALNKRIWLLNDNTCTQNLSDYKRFSVLTNVGYTPYSNSQGIVEAFFAECPHHDLSSSLLNDIIDTAKESNPTYALLYLKAGVETNASVKLTREIARLPLKVITDDPIEVPVQSFSWYVDNTYMSYAIVAHFHNSAQTDARFLNAKNSLICGLAYGLGRQILMLAHYPYTSPVDYGEMLRIHKTAANCESIASKWLNSIQDAFNSTRVETRDYADKMRRREELSCISIGDPIAEYEPDDLMNYFIRTGPFEQALKEMRSIFVGRRGTGKTAFLYKMVDELSSYRNNHVCVIKPVAYELDGLLRVLKLTISISEKGFMIESLWKYLIYSELAKSYVEHLRNLPAYIRTTEADKEIIEFCDENRSVITEEFSVRLENVLNRLQSIQSEDSSENQRRRISELLHRGVVQKLRLHLGKVLEDKDRVAIIIDNLDKNWGVDSDLNLLSQMIFALLGVTRRIVTDFEKADQRRRPVRLSLTLFLRSDIFNEVIKLARERDKIAYTRILWTDPELLLQIIERRIYTTSSLSNPEAVWDKFFCKVVDGQPIKDYITQHILPRPRDIIYLVKEALSQACNRKHTVIEEDDIKDAQRSYSRYAMDSLIAETAASNVDLESLLFEFIGISSIVTNVDILKAMKRCGIETNKLREIINMLCNLTFLGREVGEGRFEFQYDDDLRTKFEKMAQILQKKSKGKKIHYKINKPFRSYLEI